MQSAGKGRRTRLSEGLRTRREDQGNQRDETFLSILESSLQNLFWDIFLHKTIENIQIELDLKKNGTSVPEIPLGSGISTHSKLASVCVKMTWPVCFYALGF